LLLAYPEGQPLVPGGPPFYPQKFAKEKGAQIIYKYHVTKLKPLWTKAVYGGHGWGSGARTSEVNTLDFLKLVTLSNVTYGGTLMFLNMGRCDMVGRADYSRCEGKYHNADGAIIPGMAERWEQLDPTTYVITLRKGVLWPAVPPLTRVDREVTAQDVAWWLDTVRKEGALKPQFGLVNTFEATDRYTVRITMNAPDYELVRALAHHSLAIFPKECYDNQKACVGRYVSPGPMLVKENIIRQKTTYEGNKEFYLRGLPYVDFITTVHIIDTAVEKSAFVTRQVDAIRTETEVDATSLLKQVPGAEAHAIHLASGGNWFRPRMEGPMADIRVRRAMAMTMNLPELWESIAGGHSFFIPLVSRWEFGADFFMSLDQAPKWYQFNPEAAKKLMTEAGYPNGFKIDIVTSEQGTGYVNGFLHLQSQWKKYLNIDVNINRMDGAALNKLVQVDKKWDGLLWQRCGNLSCYPESQLIIATFVKDSPLNLNGLDDPKMGEFFTKVRAETDPAKRASLLWQFQEYEGEQTYVLRVGQNTAIIVMQPWELNGIPSTQGFFQVGNAPGWLMMPDPSQHPKRQ
jgi:ABC-type transport system substrate-binding protein